MFTLTIEDSNGQISERFSFDHGSYVVGRHETCDIILPSASVSRQHARIFIDAGHCYVEDLGSSNGVIVDGQRVINQRDLGTASQLRVGDFYLYLEFRRPERRRQNVLQTLFINDKTEGSKLVRINDAFAGEEFSLSETENTIGRTDDNFILLSDASVSRYHARIVRDGDSYVVSDLGSSNGTRVNRKTVKSPKTLNHGDRIHFGNLEFVFVPGDAQINPADYAGRAVSSSLVLILGVTVLVCLALAAGGVILFGFVSFTGSKSNASGEVTQTIESKVQNHIDDGKRSMKNRDWEAASASFDEALALAPQSEEAANLGDLVRDELAALDDLERGERLLEEGMHEEARDALQSIPEETQAWERAQPTLEHIRSTLAYKLKNEARRLANSSKKEELQAAHEKIRKSLELDDGQNTRAVADEIERNLTKLNVKFEPIP